MQSFAMNSATSSDFYFFGRSDGDPKETTNTPEDFFINLNRPLVLDGDWEVAVVNYEGGPYDKLYYLCCDIVESSFVNTSQLPYVKIIYEKATPTLTANKFKQNGDHDGSLRLLY